MNGNNPQTPHDIAAAEGREIERRENQRLRERTEQHQRGVFTKGPGIGRESVEPWSACEDCGAVVMDKIAHDAFHRRLELLQTAALENRVDQ